MEHLSIVLTNYIFKRGLLMKKLRNIPIWLSMLFGSFCQHNLQYCDCLVAAYVFRMPVFFLLFIPMRSFSGGLHLKTYFPVLSAPA